MLVTLLNNLVAGHMFDDQLKKEKLFNLLGGIVLDLQSPLFQLSFKPLTNLQFIVMNGGIMAAARERAKHAQVLEQGLTSLALEECSAMTSAPVAASSSLNPHAIAFNPRHHRRNRKKGPGR